MSKFPCLEPENIIKEVYFKKSNHLTAYGSFEELLKNCPECSVDHPNHEPYFCMNLRDWLQWKETGIQPDRVMIV